MDGSMRFRGDGRVDEISLFGRADRGFGADSGTPCVNVFDDIELFQCLNIVVEGILAYIEVAFYVSENCIALGKRAEIAAVGAQYLLRPARIALGLVDVADVYGIGLSV